MFQSKFQTALFDAMKFVNWKFLLPFKGKIAHRFDVITTNAI